MAEVSKLSSLNGNRCSILLDTAADCNTITEDTVMKIGLTRTPLPEEHEAEGVCSLFNVKEKAEFEIQVGSVVADVNAELVHSAPCDIILGGPFLSKYSVGYWMLIDEFSRNNCQNDKMKDDSNRDKQLICSIEIKEKLE